MSLERGFIVPDAQTDSQAFSEAVHALFGDGVTKQGGQYALSIGSSFIVGLASGFALANGRFIKHDEPFSLTVPPSGNNADRYDAIAAHVDYAERKAEITVLSDIDPESPVQDDQEYNAILYIFHVRRGAIGFRDDDLQDVREYITPLSDISGKILDICYFLEYGMDEAVERLLEMSRSLVDKAGQETDKLDVRISDVTGRRIGDIEMSMVPLSPSDEWLLCNGASVPAQYPTLSGLLGGKLPNVSQTGYYKTYMYCGAPYINPEPDPQESVGIIGQSVIGTAKISAEK